jgi:arsenate reductase (glutaredoxin)
MAITIYHNPKCGTSRTVLEALRHGGHAPRVVEYLKDGWTEALLADLCKRMAVKPRDLLRSKGTPAEELGLTRPGVGDAEILRAMVEHPILVERPIVVTETGVFLCRPADRLNAALAGGR